MESLVELTEGQRRRLRVWKGLLVAMLAGTAVCVVLEIGLFLWPGSSRGAKVVVAGLLLECFGSAVVLGAGGKCPACGARFGAEHRGLLPARCTRCGVRLA